MIRIVYLFIFVYYLVAPGMRSFMSCCSVLWYGMVWWWYSVEIMVNVAVLWSGLYVCMWCGDNMVCVRVCVCVLKTL